MYIQAEKEVWKKTVTVKACSSYSSNTSYCGLLEKPQVVTFICAFILEVAIK